MLSPLGTHEGKVEVMSKKSSPGRGFKPAAPADRLPAAHAPARHYFDTLSPPSAQPNSPAGGEPSKVAPPSAHLIPEDPPRLPDTPGVPVPESAPIEHLWPDGDEPAPEPDESTEFAAPTNHYFDNDDESSSAGA